MKATEKDMTSGMRIGYQGHGAGKAGLMEEERERERDYHNLKLLHPKTSHLLK